VCTRHSSTNCNGLGKGGILVLTSCWCKNNKDRISVMRYVYLLAKRQFIEKLWKEYQRLNFRGVGGEGGGVFTYPLCAILTKRAFPPFKTAAAYNNYTHHLVSSTSRILKGKLLNNKDQHSYKLFVSVPKIEDESTVRIVVTLLTPCITYNERIYYECR